MFESVWSTYHPKFKTRNWILLVTIQFWDSILVLESLCCHNVDDFPLFWWQRPMGENSLKIIRFKSHLSHWIRLLKTFRMYQNYRNRISKTYSKLIKYCLIAVEKVKCQGHFWQYFVFDLIYFLHLREIVSLLGRFEFNLNIYVQWSEVGRPAWRLDIILSSDKKCFDTIPRTQRYDMLHIICSISYIAIETP